VTGLFVYVRGLRGPAPEKWPEGAPAGRRGDVLAQHVLSDAEWPLSISELVRLYPPPLSRRP